MQITETSEMSTLNIITGWEINFKIGKGKRVKIRGFPACKLENHEITTDNYSIIAPVNLKLCHYRKIQIIGIICLPWCWYFRNLKLLLLLSA